MSKMREAACAVLIRPVPGGTFETLLVRRSPALAFLGGFDVFPGGVIDDVDHQLAEPSDLADGDRRAGALRELFEETGVLALGGAEAVPPPERKRVRAALLEGDAEPWHQLIRDYDLTLGLGDLLPMGAWTTPPYTPTMYHALYFGVPIPAGESVDIWPGELTDAQWWEPTAALDAHHRGELYISYPVLETLRVMAGEGEDIRGAGELLSARPATHPHAGGEMIRGVHIVPVKTFTLPPATHTNCYFLGDEELVIVDPATPIEEEQARILAYARHLGEGGGRVKEIWLTHHHQDHVGAVQEIRQALGVPVAAHARTAELLAPQIPIDRLISDGEVRTLRHRQGPDGRWVALHTPGHAPGHLCFYDPTSRALISGDNVVGLGTVLIAPPEGNMTQYMESLRRMRALDTGLLFGAHGPPVAAATEKIDFYLAHRTQREEAIFSVLAGLPPGGSLAPPDIVPGVYTDVDPRAYPLAEMNVRAHLEKLVAEGRVAAEGEAYRVT